MNHSLVAITGLHHERGEKELYAGVDFSVAPGEIVQVRGPNGHGKSTLLRILAGFITPDEGALTWKGKTFSTWTDEAIAPIIWHGEQPGWARHHTLEANWRYMRALRGLNADKEDCWISPEWWPRRFGDLSTGQRKRTALGFIEVSRASLWLLDEPLSGLDAAMSREWQERMQTAAQKGTTIIIVSHEELAFCTHRDFSWEPAAC